MVDMTKAHDRRHNVIDVNGKELGFICFFTIRGESAWRFIPKTKLVANRFPPVSPKWASADEALAHVRETMI